MWASGAFLALKAARLKADAPPSIPPPSTSPCLITSRTSYPPLLAKFIEKLDPALDGFPTEFYSAELEQVLRAWSTSLCRSTHDLESLRNSLAPGVRACSFLPSSTETLRTSHPLRIELLTFGNLETVGPEQFVAGFQAYLDSWSALETVELELFGIRVISETPLQLATDIHCDLVGTAADGSREQRTGVWHLAWSRAQEPLGEAHRWMIQRWAADPQTHTRLTGTGFREVTGHCLDGGSQGVLQLASGIDHWRTALDAASGIDVYGNHGIAVGDIDASGYDSFYVCQPSGLPNRLYRNRRDGTFEDITETSGTGILDGTASALFADFQNRGMQDLLVIRTGGPLLFVNKGNGHFEPRHEAFQFARPPQGTFTSAAVADYNRDGFLDVYFCVYSYYQGLNQYQFPSPYYDAQNGPPNFLFRNRGDGTFEDVTVATGMDQNNNRFSFAAAWCDYDNDGWPDLYVANDFGRKNLYHSNRDGTFRDVAHEAGVEDYGPGMSTCWLDHDNDGQQDIYVANMWLPEGKRITAQGEFLQGVDPTVRALYQKHNAGNSFYHNNGKGVFEDKTVVGGTSMGRWSWSCASWDFDNDGWPDIYVANGFVSGPNPFDLQSFFWRQVAQRSMTPAGATPEYDMAWNAVNELVRSDYSWSGYQRNVFFANNHNGTFTDVSGVLGLDFKDDCRAFALSDFDHDGRLEFVLKNRTGPQVRLVHNDLESIGQSVAFNLTGRTSNRDAVGAIVTIESGAARQTKFVSIGSGFASQHTTELFFGLGEPSEPIAISVRWPAGTVQHYQHIPINHRVAIKEGESTFNAIPYEPLRNRRTARASLAPASTAATVKTWLVAPLFGPELDLQDRAAKRQQLSALRGKPVLLVFLRADCGDGRKQAAELQLAHEALTAEGISLFVVAQSPTSEHSASPDLLPLADLSYPVYLADEQATGAWNIQYRYIFDRRRDMGLPTSFLLDTNGAVLVVYQGIVNPNEVLNDWRKAPAGAQAQFKRAMPFAGPYYGGEMKHNYLTFGIAFVEYGYTEEGRTAFQRAIEADPNSEFGWFNLGTIYLAKKMYPEARKYMTEAVRLNPSDSDAWNNLGTISGEEQKYDEALEQFRRAALADPDNLHAVENMMSIYRFQNKALEAQKTLEELLSKAPQNSDLHLALAMTLVAQSDLKHAREELETSVRLKPNNPDALNNLGTVLMRMGLQTEALAQFEECRRIAPDLDRACLNVALVYSNLGQTAKAREVLTEFLSRHPDNTDVRTALNQMGRQ